VTREIRENIPEWIRKQPNLTSSLPKGAAALKKLGAGGSDSRLPILHLASNENPLGPSPRAVESARAALCEAHRYAPGSDLRLREALAARHGVAVENVIVGAGSSELIELAARLMLTPGDAGVTSASTFPLYASAIQLAGGELIETRLRETKGEGRAIDLEAIGKAVNRLSARGARRGGAGARAKIVYLANPNNPTGTVFGVEDLERFLASVGRDVLVVLDEAYAEYVEREDYTGVGSRTSELIREHENVLVLRTFSKVYGLAGLRVGYGLAATVLMKELDKVRIPFNTSVVAEEAALAAMGDEEHVRNSVRTNRDGMVQLREGLGRLGLEVAPSYGNFVMVELPVEAEKIADRMISDGVIARPLGAMGLPKAMRVTVSTREGNERFLAALGRALATARVE
jgi:histidinol-phosphate aminotransferase